MTKTSLKAVAAVLWLLTIVLVLGAIWTAYHWQMAATALLTTVIAGAVSAQADRAPLYKDRR